MEEWLCRIWELKLSPEKLKTQPFLFQGCRIIGSGHASGPQSTIYDICNHTYIVVPAIMAVEKARNNGIIHMALALHHYKIILSRSYDNAMVNRLWVIGCTNHMFRHNFENNR